MADQDINAARDMAKAVHDDKCATINGRDYVITSINHIKRRKVFAYYSHIQKDIGNGDFSFLDTNEWREVENVIQNVVTFDGSLLSKLNNHWEDYPQDYITFVTTMMVSLSFPFFPEPPGV